jgi:hypothetical protein
MKHKEGARDIDVFMDLDKEQSWNFEKKGQMLQQRTDESKNEETKYTIIAYMNKISYWIKGAHLANFNVQVVKAWHTHGLYHSFRAIMKQPTRVHVT